MDRMSFISWLLDEYNTSDYIFQNEMPRYNNGLLQNLDYDSLKAFIEKTCPNRPSVIEVNKIAAMHKFISKDENTNKCPALRHIQAIDKEPKATFADVSEETKEKIRAFCSKFGKTPIFDK